MRLRYSRILAFAIAALLVSAPVFAAVTTYTATLSGAAESPPNASTGTGQAQVDIDPVAHTMRVVVVFSGLVSPTTNSHIHAATAVAGTGTAGVATRTPTFLGFPSGVTAGSYDMTYDMTQAGSWNPTYVTNNGGTTATAEAALFQAMADGKAYLNIHSQLFGGGEIRGFLAPGSPTPTSKQTWGRIKTLYR